MRHSSTASRPTSTSSRLEEFTKETCWGRELVARGEMWTRKRKVEMALLVFMR